MSGQAPSEGRKVDLGRNAPVSHETGPVPDESLAAESYRAGGEFAANVNAQPENLSTSQLRGEQLSTHKTSTTSSSSNQQTSSSYSGNNNNSSSTPASYGGTAPSYVENQYIRDDAGPHGKNITEGIEGRVEDGLSKALNAEPGSSDDPSRLAEQQMQLNQTAAGRDAGPKQTEMSNETKYDKLDETSA